jgi:hypothetical protein
MKHYHLAIRRLAKTVRSSSRRSQPATLAATLLLAYFEVWSSDHSKWCNHLFGARILLKEVPFRHMTRTILPFKRQMRLHQEQVYLSSAFLSRIDTTPPADLDVLDLGLISEIVGHPIDGLAYGQGPPVPGDTHENITDRDIENYEQLRDLYWWHCKMDIYQGILGGTKLL